MSFDLQTLSTRSEVPTWGEIRSRLVAHQGVRLVRLRTRAEIAPDARLEIEAAYGVEYDTMRGLEDEDLDVIPSALTIFVSRTYASDLEGDPLSHAAGLSPEQRRELVDRWVSAGFGFHVESGAGRPPAEPWMMADVAAALAAAADGYVILDEDWTLTLPHVDRGVYPPQEFLAKVGVDANDPRPS